jgi:hypothetical protein
MGIFDRFTRRPDPAIAALSEQVRQGDDSISLYQERLAELELALEDNTWARLSGENDREFSRDGLRKIGRLARSYWIKHPLIKRAVAIKTNYVFGQGVAITAEDSTVNAAIQSFLWNPKNRAEMTSHQAMVAKEAELEIEGNLLFALFTNRSTGAVLVRSIPFCEIDERISNPEDAKDPWYYRRCYQVGNEAKVVYYPDWRHNPTVKPASMNGHPIAWDVPVYHVSINRLGDMTWGISDLYAAIDWAKAYKDFLTDWATIVRAYSRFAWQLNTKGGKTGIAAAKTRLNTTVGVGDQAERNPPAAMASTFIAGEGTSMTPIKTAGATTSAEDGRRLLLMVCAATGISEHYFGDGANGNMASTRSMERPMELMFLERQQFWSDTFGAILDYVIDQAAIAPNGRLPLGGTRIDEYGEKTVELAINPDTGEVLSRHFDISFPDFTQPDSKTKIDAIIAASTLDGKDLAGTIDLKTISRMVLEALGEDDIDEMLAKMFPEDQGTPMDHGVAEAMRDLKEAIGRLRA